MPEVKRPKKVRFAHPLVQVQAKQVEPDMWALWWQNVPLWAKIVLAVYYAIFLVVWVLGLVKMGHCNGRQSWLWWTCIFIPIFVPVIGPLYGLVVAIVALVMLRNGGRLLNMHCKK